MRPSLSRPLLATLLIHPLCLSAQVPALPGTSADRPVRISGGVMAGLLLEHRDPDYPPDAKAKHIGGAVVLHALITPEGKVGDLTAITGPEALRDAALNAVRDWTYKPYQLNGRPVYVDTTVTVMFNRPTRRRSPGPPPRRVR